MSILQTAARRLMRKDVRRPASPVESRDQYTSMCFSGHDLRPAPSERLMETALEAFGRCLSGEIKLDDIHARPNVPDYFHYWPGEHYYLLAALMLTLRPKVVVEIGTFTGLSALTLKKHLPADGKLATFDIRPWHSLSDTVLSDADFADGRLVQHLENLIDPAMFEKHRGLLESADFFFIDAPKDGVFEYRLMELFKTLNLGRRPIALFDDTRLWSMLKFWRELPYPKLDLTSWGAWSGTGLVELA